MGAPQIIMIGLFAMNLYDAWVRDRDTKEFLVECISVALWIALLVWGGFFHEGI